VKPRPLIALLFILVGAIVGLLGMRGGIENALTMDGAVHASAGAIVTGETMIVVGLILLAWALIRLAASALSAR
jgi:hypothetical protein